MSTVRLLPTAIVISISVSSVVNWYWTLTWLPPVNCILHEFNWHPNDMLWNNVMKCVSSPHTGQQLLFVYLQKNPSSKRSVKTRTVLRMLILKTYRMHPYEKIPSQHSPNKHRISEMFTFFADNLIGSSDFQYLLFPLSSRVYAFPVLWSSLNESWRIQDSILLGCL